MLYVKTLIITYEKNNSFINSLVIGGTKKFDKFSLSLFGWKNENTRKNVTKIAITQKLVSFLTK